MGSLDTKARGLGSQLKAEGHLIWAAESAVFLSLSPSHFSPALLSTLPDINALKTNTTTVYKNQDDLDLKG